MAIGVPFEKGKSGNPKGRPKGSHNKFRYGVAEILKKNNCNPFEILAQIANGTLPTSTLKDGFKERLTIRLRMEAAAELAQYIAPKLKAVEMSNDPENPIEVNIQIGHAN